MGEAVRVFISTVGTRGDVQPFLAIAKQFLKGGVAVAIATHEEFRVLVEGVPGCSFVALDGSPTTDMRQFPAAFVQGVISEEIAFSKQVAQSQAKNKRKIFDGAKAFGANFMVSMMSCHLECTSVAARLGVPSVVCSTYPLYPSAERVPMSMMANEREFPVVVARFFSWIGFKVAWSMAKGEMNAWRAELGLEPLSGISWDMCPVVNLYSSTLAPRPRDWPRHVHDGGFCVMHDVDGDAAPFAPTPELQEFLGSGGPPIYFGFGSMPAMGGMAQVRLFVQACTRLQRRGLVSAPGVAEADRGGVLTEDVRWIGSVPHEWLFPHCAAAVHHGGAGTTAATLRAGIPCVIFHYVSSVLGDQCFWAKQCAALGVGPAKTFGVRALSEETLVAQLREVLENDAVARNARMLGEQLRSENGTKKTVDLLLRLFEWMSPRQPLEDHWMESAQQEYCAECGESCGVVFNTPCRCAGCGKRACSSCLPQRQVLMNNDARKCVCETCMERLGHNGTTDVLPEP